MEYTYLKTEVIDLSSCLCGKILWTSYWGYFFLRMSWHIIVSVYRVSVTVECRQGGRWVGMAVDLRR